MTKERIFRLSIIGLVIVAVAAMGAGAVRILNPIMGGTGTGTIATAGAVPYSSSSTTGAYTYDASNFNYNSSTHTLTAGTFAGNVTLPNSITATSVASSGAISKTDANGQQAAIGSVTQLVTIAAAATTATTIQIPANSIVLGIPVLVTTAIPTATTFTYAGTSAGGPFQTGASVSVNLNTSDVGTKACPYLNTSAQTITITPNGTPATNVGRVRVTIYYIQLTAPTS